MGWFDGLVKWVELRNDIESEGETGVYDLGGGNYEEQMAQYMAQKNANMILKAADTEIAALTQQYNYESDTMVVDALSYLGATVLSLESARKAKDVATTQSDIARDTDIVSYAVTYMNTQDRVAAQEIVDRTTAGTQYANRVAGADATYQITTGKAELDLNNDIMLAELIASETITQAELTRAQVVASVAVETGATIRDAESTFGLRKVAAAIVSKYRTETELAKSMYEAVHSVASTQARIGASGFAGASGELVTQDLQNFYDGQTTALRSNINAELNLAMDSASTSYTNTVATASEKSLLQVTQANQDYIASRDTAFNRIGVATQTASSTFENVIGAATLDKDTTYGSAGLSYTTAIGSAATVSAANKLIADRNFITNTNNAIATHSGRISAIDLDYEVARADKELKIDQYIVKFDLANEFNREAYESEKDWIEWKSEQEASIARKQGTLAEYSIGEQQDQADFQTIATVANIIL